MASQRPEQKSGVLATPRRWARLHGGKSPLFDVPSGTSIASADEAQKGRGEKDRSGREVEKLGLGPNEKRRKR
jgi:hypothetical protein